MIKRLTLNNFQSHELTELDFDSGFNVIVGPSDNGKSSIIRAIEWIRSNRPRGNDFIRTGSKESEVLLRTDASAIVRKRDAKTTGSYTLFLHPEENISKAKGQTFSVVGNDVPEPVTDILQLQDINIQLQLDGHFLVFDTPGKIAQYFNSVTKLDVLNTGLQELKSKKRKTNELLTDCNNRMDVLEQKWTEEILDLFTKSKKLCKRLEVVVLKSNEAKEYYKNLEAHVYRITEAEKSMIPEKPVKKVEKLFSELTGIVEELNDLQLKFDKLQKLLESLKTGDGVISNQKKMIAEKENELEELKKKFTHCPYCLQKLTKEAKEVLLNG